MFSPLVYVFISLHPFFNTLSAGVHPSGHENSAWFVGCVNAGDSFFTSLSLPKGAHDLDPVTCSASCLDEGYQVAALTLESCYCGNQELQGWIFSECFNTSSNGGSDVRGESERQSLPVGSEQGIVALYRTEGPFLHSINLSAPSDRVQAGKTFVVVVSGNLAGRPNQPTGIQSLGGQDLSYVTVEFLDRTPKGQSSHHVSLLDDGSFVMPSDWILETPGKYVINVSVSNLLSTLSSTLHLSVSQPPPNSLVISVLHGPLGVPSCTHLQQTDSHSMQAAYLGDPVTLQAYVGEGRATEFCWWFIHEKREEEKKGVKTACFPNSDCLISMLNWTFDTEGVHMVSVNASSLNGWTQQTINVEVVRLAVSDLKVSISRNYLRAGGCISVDVELFATMKHLLVLNLTLNAENDHKYEDSVDLSSKGKDINSCSGGNFGNNCCSINGSDMKNNILNDDRSVFSNEISANATHFNKTESHISTITDWKNSNDDDCNCSNHGNITHDHNLNQGRSNIRCHGGPRSYSHHFIPLHLLHTSNQSGCRLQLHLGCRLPTTAGRYHVTASVFSTPDPSSVLISTVLPQVLMVYEHICALRPSGNWTSVFPADSEFSLEVVSHGGRLGSRIIWTFSLENVVVINKTTEEWNINVSLPLAGRYNVTVKACNPVSWTSFETHILVQDIVGELILNVPSVIGTEQKQSLLFSVAAGSNMTVSLLVNATLQYRNSSYATGEQATVVLLFNHTGTAVVELRAENEVSSQNKSVRVCVEGNRKPSPQVRVNSNWQPPTSQSPVHSLGDIVQIYAAKQAYPTNTDITFLAVTDVPDLLEFIWHFGDSTSTRTTSRTVTKRYHKPGRFDVVVVMSGGHTSITSEVFPLVVQKAVKLNRLVHQASVLQNQTVTVSCRVNVGTNLTFLWNFGDGSSRLGQSTEQHVFKKTGEFRVQVTVSNLVSSASLSSHIFVVDCPCQPPPVKNMGPLKLQVRRYEVICLGVTYETDIDCDISGGLQYTWTLFDSAGQTFHLPFTDTHRQSLTLQSHLLLYDTYTAIARVQVIGSMVYSNYSVRVQVVPSPPVAVIQGGTNIFINNRNTAVLTLDGRRSYDPDFPTNPLSYSWMCKPLSSITTPCFSQHVPTSFPVLVFPVSFLKPNFDQFQFTLTIHSGERSASSETFLTVTPNLLGKVSVYCLHCQGDQVNWGQPFSVSALCEDCDVSPEHIQYTWSLYLVNASSRPVLEVPFCYTVDLSAPSSIISSPASSPQTPGTSTLPPSDTDASHYTGSVHASDPVLLTEIISKTIARKQNLGLTDRRTSSKKSRNMSRKAGEEPFHHSLGKFDHPEHHPSTEYPPLTPDNSGVLYPEHFGQSDVNSEFPIHYDSSAEWEFPFPVLETGDVGGRPDSDYNVPFPSAEEGDPGISAGRPTGVEGETLSPGDDSAFDPAVHEDEGSNLVVSRPSVVIQEPTLLDLPRDLVDRGLFESYTRAGISSSLLSFRPFSLRPGGIYMLEVTAKSQNSLYGRTQLFLESKPAPKGMTCQVQPVRGMEVHTHFSIFCTSGKEDLLYEHSFSVGGRPPRVLYQGRDFQFYFSLPSGDPSDDYKVTVYTEVRSSTYGTATKPCPVTVQVHPSFLRDTSSRHDPDLELFRSGLRNVSALVQLGNSRETRNYISLLSSILNRLSRDTEANAHAQRLTRNVLICTVCELESGEQASMVDSISILKDLLQVTHQVTVASARRVTVYIQAISDLFLESSALVRYHLDHNILNTLVAMLSYILQGAVTNHDFTPERSDIDNITQVLESDSPAIASPDGCIPASSTGDHTKWEGSVSTKQRVQLVVDVLQTASDLMLKYMLLHKVQEHRVSTGLFSLYATYQNQTSTVISSGSATFYMPASLIQLLFGGYNGDTESKQRRPCVFSLLTELARIPYTSDHYPPQLSGPVVDLSLYKCSVRRKIPVRSFVLPINVELQHPPRNETSAREYVLSRIQINYHSFNITQDHLQQAIQLSVVFTPPPNKVFPVLLLFRMFERPTPSMHHLHSIHHWESNTVRITLPPSYLNAAGVGHLALLNADFGKAPKHKHLSGQVSYRLAVISSLCLSLDGHQGAWTHHDCKTQQADASTAVNCSCHQLRPLTVVQHQIQSSHDTADLDPFLSVSRDLTVLGVLVLCVCLYIPGLLACKRADDIAEKNRRVHYLPDNSPFEPYLYAVTIHTGLCSAANMSAKVYIVLYGEDGLSHTRELQVPGCTLFRRNSQDTFILSAADSLGPVWGVHIWHDNSGSSPNWYLKQVEVSEVNRGHVKGRDWLFVGQCWLAVNKGDGQVERMMRVCTQGLSFTKMSCFKLSDYLADFHIWISVYSCPCPNLFTHTQRLSVCLLLLLGYACVNTVIISQMDDQLLFELGILDVSAVSVTTGVLSVVAVLPGATMISFLFRLHGVKLTMSGVQHATGRKTEKDHFEDALSVNDSVLHLSWRSLKQWIQEAWRKKYQGTDLLSVSSTILENKDTDKEPVIQPDVITGKEDDRAIENRMGPVLQNLLHISRGGNADHATQGKECDPSSASSLFLGTQEELLSSRKQEDQALQEEKGPQGKCSLSCGFEEGSHHQAAWSDHSSGCHVNDKLRGRKVGPTSQRCQHLAWSLCLLLSLSCLVLSAVLGMRFSSSKVLLWTHSLFFSLVFCIFFIQPALIFTVALAVSFWYRKRPDFHTFSRIKEFEIEASKPCCYNGAARPEEQLRASAFPQERCSYLERLLAARQRARYLRLVCPPTPAELRKARGRKRRETLIHNTLRDLSVCVSMVLLMLCVTYGSSFGDHYHLNKAVRKQFTRNDDNDFMSIQKQEDWWKWARTSLLNLLYMNSSAKMEQSRTLIGEPVLWKVEASSAFEDLDSGVTLVPEGLRLFLLGSKTSTYPRSTGMVPTVTPSRTCGHLGCYSGPSTTVGLGRTKSDAASKLNLLHSAGWLGRQTVALKVQFTVFSPAPNLFSSVTLLTEQSPTSVLFPSSKVQSVRVYRTPAVWDYVVMVCQLLFLVLSLLQLCHQVCTVRQQGLMGYWRSPCNWLEVILLTATLVYYVYYIYHSLIITDVAEQLQRHRGHVDVSFLATWEQDIRTLRGVALFLLTIKCVTVLRVNRTLATSATLLTCSLSRLFWPMISGVILLVALSCAGNLLFVQSSLAFSSIPRSLQTLLCHYWGLRPARGLLLSGRDFLYSGVLFLSSTVVWTAVVMCVVSSLVRSAKRSQSRRDVFTVAELASYIRRRISEFTGQRQPTWSDEHMERKTYYLEEFESLVDELLFRLNALSNCLHHTLPPKARDYTEEESPVTSLIQEQRGQRRKHTSSDIILTPDDPHRTGKTAEEDPNDRDLRGQDCLSLPESTSLIKTWTEDIPEKQADQWTRTNDSCWLSKTQATHTEVVVEVLVHEEPGGVEV